MIVNHQVFHTNITVDGHEVADRSSTASGPESPPGRYIIQPEHEVDHGGHGHHHHHHHHNDHDHDDEEGFEDEDELEDEFDDYNNGYPVQGLNTRIITTVPAKEPVYNAVPLKSAMKKGSSSNGLTNSSSSSSSGSSKSEAPPSGRYVHR